MLKRHAAVVAAAARCRECVPTTASIKEQRIGWDAESLTPERIQIQDFDADHHGRKIRAIGNRKHSEKSQQRSKAVASKPERPALVEHKAGGESHRIPGHIRWNVADSRQ